MNQLPKPFNNLPTTQSANFTLGAPSSTNFFNQDSSPGGVISSEISSLNRDATSLEVSQKTTEIMNRLSVRTIKFCQIDRNIIIGESEGTSCGNEVPIVFLDNIEFTEGVTGKIDYSGCNSNKPNLTASDFCIKIPCMVSAFIVRVSVSLGDSYLKAHWWIDLKLRQALALSIIRDGLNPCYSCCFQNTSAMVIACNKHILPNINNNNNSNLRLTLTDKDTVVAPYNICLFSSNIY